jgi:hypothetical protein
MGVVRALNPTLITRPLAQLWIVSNAGDQHSEMWWHYTELGRRMVDVPDASLCWIEYAPPGDPTTIDVHNESHWRAANPSMGQPGGVDEIALRAASQENDIATFRREHLNLWADRALMVGLSEVEWAGCYRPELVPGEQLAFGLDFDMDRTVGALVSAGSVLDLDGARITPLEVIDVSTDFDHLVQRAAANANEFNGLVVIQAGSPAASEIPTLERLTTYGRKGKHRVKVLSQPEMARAVGSFYDAVTARRLSHRNDPTLNDDVRQVTRRAIGDVFVWERHGPLSAATLARWGVLTAPEARKPAVASIGSPVSRQRSNPAPLTTRRLPVRRIG